MTIIEELISIAYDYADTHTPGDLFPPDDPNSYKQALRIRAMGYAFSRVKYGSAAGNHVAAEAWTIAFWRIHDEK